MWISSATVCVPSTFNPFLAKFFKAGIDTVTL